MTVALLDRLCYNAVILLTKGPSYRTRGRLGTPSAVAADHGVADVVEVANASTSTNVDRAEDAKK